MSDFDTKDEIGCFLIVTFILGFVFPLAWIATAFLAVGFYQAVKEDVKNNPPPTKSFWERAKTFFEWVLFFIIVGAGVALYFFI